MSQLVRVLDAARHAYSERDWVGARDGFRAVADGDSLVADDLQALSSALWWLGQMEESMAAGEAAHREYLVEDRPQEAAGSALDLAINHYLRGDGVLGSAWVARASRLLEDQPETPIHGYLVYVSEVEADWRTDRSDDVVAAARNVRRIGLEYNDPSLAAIASNGEGCFLIEEGEVDEGLRLLDEAMAAVLAGDVDPEWMGKIYCNTIAACQALGDLDRMRRWTEATEEWLDTLPGGVLFAGICRVHRADLLRVTGDWGQAEEEAGKACLDLIGLSTGHVSEAWYQVGELRRLRGDTPGADEAYRAAHRLGRDPQPGLALLRMAEGGVEAAYASIGTALAATTGSLKRAPLLGAGVEIALAADRANEARRFSAELSDIAGVYRSSGLEALAATSAGSVAMAEGSSNEALGLLREAVRHWRELRAPYEAAKVSVTLGLVYRSLGDEETAQREFGLAADEFRRLGADSERQRVVHLLNADRVDGLTDREIEVLALVARGRSNKAIGEELFISPKTVARHLSNIFTKLDVSSRTGAARYALEHHIG